MSSSTQRTRKSITSSCSTGLQNDLFFIACPHDLKNFAKSRVGVRRQQYNVHIQYAAQVQRALVIICLKSVADCFDVKLLGFWDSSDLPTQRQINAHVVDPLEDWK
jgi:hypothetical protein